MIAQWRIYFNRRGDPDQAWSIDTGQGTPRWHFPQVTIINHHPITSHSTGKEPDWKNPVAWIETWGKLTVTNGIALITWAAKPAAGSKAKPARKNLPRRGSRIAVSLIQGS